MKLQLKHLFSIAILSILLVSCNDNCEEKSVKIGEVDYAELTKSYLNYDAGQTLVFENADAETISFEVTEEDSLNTQLCTKVICRPSFDITALNGCEYYEGKSDYFVLRSDDVFLHLKAGIELYEAESMLFYDFVEVGITSDESSEFAGFVSDTSFAIPTLSFQSTILQDTLSYVGTVDTLPYENLWIHTDEDQDTILWFDQIQGLTGFSYQEKFWILK